jgi:tetratricopeptide (TPR) repeat protein
MPGDTIAATIRREAADGVVASYLNRARTARKSGDLRTAELAYLTVIAAEPQNTDFLMELSELCIQLGKYDKVLEYAKQAVAAAPNDPAVHTNLAVIYLNLNDPAEAEKELLHAIQINGNFGRAYYFLGNLYRMSGRSNEAREAFRKVRELGYRE